MGKKSETVPDMQLPHTSEKDGIYFICFVHFFSVQHRTRYTFAVLREHMLEIIASER